jgi:hypothetical protein
LLGGKVFLSTRREPVIAGALTFIGEVPGGHDPAASFEAMEGRVKRTGFHLQHFFGGALDMPGDGMAVGRPVKQGAENQDIERALEEVDAGKGIGHSVVSLLKVE